MICYCVHTISKLKKLKKYRRLNGNIQILLNRLAPLKSRRVRHSPQHWFNNEIKQAMDERKIAYDNLRVNDPHTLQQRTELISSRLRRSNLSLEKRKRSQLLIASLKRSQCVQSGVLSSLLVAAKTANRETVTPKFLVILI